MLKVVGAVVTVGGTGCRAVVVVVVIAVVVVIVGVVVAKGGVGPVQGALDSSMGRRGSGT